MKVSDIRSDVPIPEFKKYGFSAQLRKMEVGDSITVTEYTKDNTVRTGIYRIQKLTGKKFTTRKDEGGSLMIWRTE